MTKINRENKYINAFISTPSSQTQIDTSQNVQLATILTRIKAIESEHKAHLLNFGEVMSTFAEHLHKLNGEIESIKEFTGKLRASLLT